MSERVAGWVGGKVGIQCLGLEMQRPNYVQVGPGLMTVLKRDVGLTF